MKIFVRVIYFLIGVVISPLLMAEVVKPSRPDIILVMADDHGWGDVGYNGHPWVQTPTMNEMAAEGFVFDRFYAAAPVCSPTRASVLTGRHPIRGKVHSFGNYLRPHEQTIAETLKSAGYVTGIFGKLHIGSAQPDTPCNPGGMGFDEWIVGLNFFDNDPYLSRNGKVEHRKGKGTALAMEDGLDFLKRHQEGEKPIFMVVWFPSPHDPHDEVPDGLSLYDDKPHRGYYREITLIDQQLSRLRTALRASERGANTILWYCGDNGGLVKETSGGRDKKGSIYEGGLRVPAIVEWPSHELKGRSAVPVTTSDLYPTLLTMAGVELFAPHPLDGMDVSELISGKMASRASGIGFWSGTGKGDLTYSDQILKSIMEKQQANTPLPHDEPRLRKDVDEFPQYAEDFSKGHAAWLHWPWKLHRIEGHTFELYDLERDPMETTDISQEFEQLDRLSRMSKELDAWMRSVIRSLNGADYPKDELRKR